MKKFFELSKSEEEEAQELHRKSVVVDGLQSSVFTDEYFKTVRDAGVTATSPTVSTEAFGRRMNLSVAVGCISDWYSKIDKNNDSAVLATTVEDILRAKEENKVAYLLNFQDTTMLEGDVNLLDVFYRLGIRQIQLTYNEKNNVGDGCGERTDCGLSRFGIEVIERMNKLRILVDISHVGDKTSMEAIERAEYIVCSHSNARAICNNVRNKDDETIKALAEKKGIIGVNSFPTFVKWTKTEIGERPTVNDLLDHIDYIVKLVGVDYVGLGLDLNEHWPFHLFRTLDRRPDIWGKPSPKGTYDYAEGIDTVSNIINVTRGLVARGYSKQEIQKILGQNWLRVYKRAFGK